MTTAGITGAGTGVAPAFPRAGLGRQYPRCLRGGVHVPRGVLRFRLPDGEPYPPCPRARFILELSRPVDRAEGIRLGEALQRQIEARLGLGVVQLDPSVYRGEQPIYGPLIEAETMRYHGAPVEVDQVLKDAQPLEEMPGRAERAAAIASPDPVVHVLAHRKLVKRDHSDGKLSIICPFENSHTEPGGESSTVYFLPNFGGVRYGKFVCKHTHCKGRRQEDYLTALGLDPREAWREQANGAAPYHDLAPVESYDEADQQGARRPRASAKARLWVRLGRAMGHRQRGPATARSFIGVCSISRRNRTAGYGRGASREGRSRCWPGIRTLAKAK
jgi:hypothetical protein